MAAAVALLFAGYAWLAGQFPPPDTAQPLPDRGMTGWNRVIVPLQNGGEADVEEMRLPNGERRFHIQERQQPSPQR
jgi:hypothetical protein